MNEESEGGSFLEYDGVELDMGSLWFLCGDIMSEPHLSNESETYSISMIQEKIR